MAEMERRRRIDEGAVLGDGDDRSQATEIHGGSPSLSEILT
jgi:hypothetical protein